MSKKSRQKKQRKLQRRGLAEPAPSLVWVQGDSPAQRAMQERIRRGGDHYLQDNLIRILQNSYRLRPEPEFRDLYFDLHQTDTVSSRVMRKFDPQLPEVLKKSKDEQQQFYDEVRIEIVEELATPAFRQDVLKRLERLAQRLASGKETDKFEMALVLPPMLKQKEIEWGLCGLITTIYEESREKAERQFHQALSEFEKIVGPIKDKSDLDKLLTLTDDSPEIAHAVERLQAQPDVMETLRQDADQAFEEFEEQIAQGQVQLDLFDAEELQRPLRTMADYVAEKEVDLASADQSEMTKRFAEFIHQALAQVMTPDRVWKMKADVKRLSAQWLKEKNWQGVLLQAEISWLDSEPPAENPFVSAVYMGQLQRWRDAQVASIPPADAATRAESESPQIDAAPNAPRGWRERITDRFGKRKEP